MPFRTVDLSQGTPIRRISRFLWFGHLLNTLTYRGVRERRIGKKIFPHGVFSPRLTSTGQLQGGKVERRGSTRMKAPQEAG